MTTQGRSYILVTLSVISLFLITACSSGGGTGKSSGSTLSTLQVLHNSTNAMKQLKSVHFDMNNVTELAADTGTPTTSTSTPNQFTIKLVGNGDQVLPDQVSLHMTAAQGTQNFDLSEVVSGKKIYIKNPAGKWYVLDASNIKDAANNPFSQMDISSYSKLLALAEKASFVDHGTEKLNGKSLRHITATFGKDALKDLLDATGQLKNLPVQQQKDLDRVLSAIKLDKTVLDLWADETTSYVQRMEMKLNMGLDLKALQTPTTSDSSTQSSTPSNVKINSDVVVDYSKFNQPVTISVPTDAEPVNDFMSIFR